MTASSILNGAESSASTVATCPAYRGEPALDGFPAQGELVTYVPDLGRSKRGWVWVCVDTADTSGPGGSRRVSAVLFDPCSEGSRYTVLKGVSAGQLVPVPEGSVGPMKRAPLHFPALAELAAQNVELQRVHEAWMENLVSEAQEWADQHGMCSAFEEFMHDHDLAGRERELEFSVRLEVTVSVPVTSRFSEQEARDSIDSDAVLEALKDAGLSSYDWEVEE